MAAQLELIPDLPETPAARLRQVLFRVSDRLCVRPAPDVAQLQSLVQMIREAYDQSGMQLPLLNLHIQNMLRDLRPPADFDAAYYANQLSQAADRIQGR